MKTQYTHEAIRTTLAHMYVLVPLGNANKALLDLCHETGLQIELGFPSGGAAADLAGLLIV